MKMFHAHIYSHPEQLPMLETLSSRLPSQGPLKIWRLFDQPVGPHPLPMLELHFKESNKASALLWLEQNRGYCSVLIHEETGNDVKDHENALWLGNSLPLNFGFFAALEKDPSLAVHAVKPDSRT